MKHSQRQQRRQRRRQALARTMRILFSPRTALVLSWSLFDTHAFAPLRPSPTHRIQTNTALYVGIGVANNYSWKEEQFEIEVKVAVPAHTSAKDIKFTCSSDSISLLLINNSVNRTDDEIVLLDGARKMRGKICVDGTFGQLTIRITQIKISNER